MQYPKLGMENAVASCLVRKEVYNMILKASAELPRGYYIKIWDGWRPFVLQEEIYNKYYSNIVKTFELEEKSEEERTSLIKQYVSLPKINEYVYPVHVSGGAIDVTLADGSGNDICMGTKFDEMTLQAQTDYFESAKDEDLIKSNRRMLYTVMKNAGFTNLPTEWWHYDYGDRFWAFYKQKPMIYRPIYKREDVHVE